MSRARAAAAPSGAVERTVEVTLLTQEHCDLCDHAKTVLARLSQDLSVQARLLVTEVDLASAQGRHLASEAGVLFAPGVLLDGMPFAHGRLSERKLRKALS